MALLGRRSAVLRPEPTTCERTSDVKGGALLVDQSFIECATTARAFGANAIEKNWRAKTISNGTQSEL